MHELHVVGRDIDGGLLLSPGPSHPPSHRVADVDAVRRALEREPEPRTAVRHPRRQLSPAQLQARLRAGSSVDELARETGLRIDEVERWAGPVEAERSRVLSGAMASHVAGDDGAESPKPLGQLVAARSDDVVTWTTTRRRDGRWRVLLRVERGGRLLTASWVYDLRTGELAAASQRARTLSFPAR